MKKKIVKFFKIILMLLFLNQLIIQISINDMKKGWWKSNSSKRLKNHDVLIFDKNLKYSIISENDKSIGIVQLYVGKKLLISNMNLTEWYLYEHK